MGLAIFLLLLWFAIGLVKMTIQGCYRIPEVKYMLYYTQNITVAPKPWFWLYFLFWFSLLYSRIGSKDLYEAAIEFLLKYMLFVTKHDTVGQNLAKTMVSALFLVLFSLVLFCIG